MKDKSFVKAGMFYGTFMTCSIFFMWKSVSLLNERVTKLEHKCEERQKVLDSNMDQINKNFKAQKNLNKQIVDILKDLKTMAVK